jgi:osmoprotectant transport system ATP-binding protein
MGPSGCGKTTSPRMSNRVIEPDSGRVLPNGRDTATIAAHELRRGVGYAIQQAGLFPHPAVHGPFLALAQRLQDRQRLPPIAEPPLQLVLDVEAEATDAVHTAPHV